MNKVITILIISACLAIMMGGCASQAQIGGIEPLSQGATLIDVSLAGDNTTSTPEVQTEVMFADINLESVIRNIINKPKGDIYDTDLRKVIAVEATHSNITDLSGIEYCVNAKELYFAYNNISDLSPLSNLPGGIAGSGDSSFTTLHISLVGNPIKDLTPLANLTAPDELTLVLDRTGISNLSPLASLSNLICLYASQNEIKEIPRNSWHKLSVLYLWRNEISDVSNLATATSLWWVNLEDNNVADISCLDHVDKLYIDGNPCEAQL